MNSQHYVDYTLANVGSVVAWLGWATLQINGNWSWRTITLLQIMPSVIQMIFIYWVPESPRWMIFKGKNEQALNVLAYYHAGGDVSNPTVQVSASDEIRPLVEHNAVEIPRLMPRFSFQQFEYKEIKETIALEKEVINETSYIDFFKTKGNRWRLAIVSSILDMWLRKDHISLTHRQIISLGIISQYSGNAIFSNYSNLVYEGAGIMSQNKKMPVSLPYLATSRCRVLTDCAAQWRQYHHEAHRLRQRRAGRRPLWPPQALPYCDRGYGSHVRVLDHHVSVPYFPRSRPHANEIHQQLCDLRELQPDQYSRRLRPNPLHLDLRRLLFPRLVRSARRLCSRDLALPPPRQGLDDNERDCAGDPGYWTADKVSVKSPPCAES